MKEGAIALLLAACMVILGTFVYGIYYFSKEPVSQQTIVDDSVSLSFVSGTEYKPGQGGQVIVEARYPNGTTAITSNVSQTTWNWDFENDGIIDDTTQNPVHTFSTGKYDVNLTGSYLGSPYSVVKGSHILVGSEAYYGFNGSCAGMFVIYSPVYFSSLYAPPSPTQSMNLTPGTGLCWSQGVVGIGDNYTYSIWVYPLSDVSTGYITARQVSFNSETEILQFNGNRTITFTASGANVTSATLSHTWAPGTFSNQWINVVVSRRGTNLSMYAGGSLVNSTYYGVLPGSGLGLNMVGGFIFASSTTALVDELIVANFGWTSAQAANYYPPYSYPVSPVANFTANVTSGSSPLTVQFNANVSSVSVNASSCLASVWYPDKTPFIVNQTMLFSDSNGNAYISFTVPNIDGVYEYQAICAVGNKSYIASKSFHVTKPRISAVIPK